MKPKHITYLLTLLVIATLTSFGLRDKTSRIIKDNYEIVGHAIDTINENLTAHKFSLFITTKNVDTKINIARRLESTKGRISNSILFFDNKESAIAYSKTWKMTPELTSDLKASYFSNNKFHKETFCFGNDTLTVNEYGIVSGWTNCKTVTALSKDKRLN